MLYRIRLQYSLHVEARDKSEAFSIATKMLRDNPGAAIAQIEQASAPRGNPPLWKRLLTGK